MVGQYNGTGSPAEQYGNLNTSEDAVAGLYDIVSDPGTSWNWDFNYGNDLAWERDWKATGRLGGDDSIYTDDVDLNAYCGHGFANKFVFSTEMDDWYSTISDIDMGDRDCEWMLTFTCNFLTGSMSTFGPAADNVHLICGYATDMTVTSNAGSRFAYWAKQPYGVRVAWYKYGYDTQNGANQNIARIFGAKASVNDYLWGYGSVSADPPFYTSSPSSYTYWDYKLNW
ncbi:MAG: DUF6345 domain-containing protein [Actinomycetota bacterium]|nr:DUF6345 domain-containing protein [Actinomycetota bacterium]